MKALYVIPIRQILTTSSFVANKPNKYLCEWHNIDFMGGEGLGTYDFS